ncbi:MAG: hypothetical protein Q9M91_03905 [Candidatus Dojkabacteria bacterium]|nr:hypothetical protein [Candidatus Dojkabacteria bacterium]MDQ7020957.1 hypothetical protein [Candidatus Dojkabacteria bacterium]
MADTGGDLFPGDEQTPQETRINLLRDVGAVIGTTDIEYKSTTEYESQTGFNINERTGSLCQTIVLNGKDEFDLLFVKVPSSDEYVYTARLLLVGELKGHLGSRVSRIYFEDRRDETLINILLESGLGNKVSITKDGLASQYYIDLTSGVELDEDKMNEFNRLMETEVKDAFFEINLLEFAYSVGLSDDFVDDVLEALSLTHSLVIVDEITEYLISNGESSIQVTFDWVFLRNLERVMLCAQSERPIINLSVRASSS